MGIVRDGRLERQEVSVGLRAAGYVEIVSGVSGGELVARFASADDVGTRVRVVAEDPVPEPTGPGS